MKYFRNILKTNTAKIVLAAVIVLLSSYGLTQAGSLTPSATPSAIMYTFGDIYTRLTTNATSTAGNHPLTSTSSPASTFHTLTEIYNAIPTIDSTKVLSGTTYLGVAGTYSPAIPNFVAASTTSNILVSTTSVQFIGTTSVGPGKKVIIYGESTSTQDSTATGMNIGYTNDTFTSTSTFLSAAYYYGAFTNRYDTGTQSYSNGTMATVTLRFFLTYYQTSGDPTTLNASKFQVFPLQ